MKNARVRNRGRGGKHNLARDKATADALLDLLTTATLLNVWSVGP